ncbi:MAG: hypothetical protein ACOYIA_05450 [Eubacteriales bacterium]|jgi:glutamine synthetase
MKNLPDYFGCLVFDERVMKAKLPPSVYSSLKKTIDEGTSLESRGRKINPDFFKNVLTNKRLLHIIMIPKIPVAEI